MVKILIIGDSHLKGLNSNKLTFQADINARGGRRAHHLSESFFAQEQYKKYDSFFIILGGNDVHHHEQYNPNPKTPEQTANHLISCQFCF